MTQDIWFWIHISFFIAGMGGLAGAVITAGLYLWQSQQLKSKHPGKIFFNLPSLDALDQLQRRLLGAGVVLFSLGIISGIFWAKKFNGIGCIFKDPKVLFSFTTCFFYWLIWSLRAFSLRRGHKIAMGTVLAFLLLFLTLLSTHHLAAALSGGVS